MKSPSGGWAPMVSAVARAFGRDPTPAAVAALCRWLELLVSWNTRLDLTAARSPEELVDLMVADAMFLSGEADTASRWVDVGSGAGAPGLALGALRPDLQMTLVEPLQKRVAFLRNVVGDLGSRSISVRRGRGEELAPGSFDVALSRATLAPEGWAELAKTLVVPGGRFWVLLAREEPPRVAGWRAAVDRSYAWPMTGAVRRAVGFGAIAPSTT